MRPNICVWGDPQPIGFGICWFFSFTRESLGGLPILIHQSIHGVGSGCIHACAVGGERLEAGQVAGLMEEFS